VQPVLEVRRVSKAFDRRNVILKDVSFVLMRGEMVALIGASGSGKSTLIRAIAGLVPIDRTGRRAAAASGDAADAPSDGPGEIILFGQSMQRNGRISGAATNLRVRVGVIFQQFNLVPRLSVLTNVCLGLLGRVPFLLGTIGRFSEADKCRAMHALDRVGIATHALKRGCELSGGQQQRAAIARTLVQGAELVIADEPTASPCWCRYTRSSSHCATAPVPSRSRQGRSCSTGRPASSPRLCSARSTARISTSF
jgi:phosphonate transport system ATP-binding protein